MAYNRKLLYTKSFPSWNTPEGDLGDIAQNGNPINPIQLVATEINEPGSTITYAVTTGALPTGLTLSSSGEISGTLTGYTAAETVNFTITATDDEGETASRDFSFQVLIQYQIDYLVVAGGGGGGGEHGGGGGAGGVLSSNTILTNNTIYSIAIGQGGASGGYNRPPNPVRGGSGGDSSFSVFTAIGGGGGGGRNYQGGSGGSGGGSGPNYPVLSGGAGTIGQGNNGGAGTEDTDQYAGGGGGGAGEAGQSASNAGAVKGDGGDGIQSSITGTSIYYAGGGGGCTLYASGAYGAGGLGGGGRGATTTLKPSSGTPNTGGGGGGANRYATGGTHQSSSIGPAGQGGSGVVILRMPTANYSGTTTGSPTVTTDGSDTILKYTGSGTYTA